MKHNSMEVSVNNRILITYATKYGATAEIAVKIGNVLRESGLETDVVPIEHVREVHMYRAVIIGSAIYMGQWRKEAITFLKSKETVLSERPTWIFSSGPTGEGDPQELLKGWYYPEKLQHLIEAIHPRNVTIFHGGLNVNKLNMLEKWIVRNVKAETGDFRDWDTITAWAAQIACDLKKPEFA